jgi:hypothetical protein
MRAESMACAVALLSATVVTGCGSGNTAAGAGGSSERVYANRAGTLSVSAFRVSGWQDESFHYLPALSVAAPSSGRPVFVQRVDFTAEDAGARRLLKGIRYATSKRVPPGSAVDLVTGAESADPPEIASPIVLTSITAIVFFSDDEGQTGIVSASAFTPKLPDGNAVASIAVRDFTVDRRRQDERFVYRPRLTLVETTGRSRATIKKIVFELLDAGRTLQTLPVWNAPDVPAGGTMPFVSVTSRGPRFEIESTAEASRVSVAISFVDDAGRGGRASAVAAVSR